MSYSLIFLLLLAFVGFLAISKLRIPQKSKSWLFFGPSLFSLWLTAIVFWKDQTLHIGSDQLGLRLDILSGVLSTFVLIIGGIVFQYSIRYLDDDPKQLPFLRNLSLTLTSVLAMLLAQDFITLLVAWVSTSYVLHLLLMHFHERKGALKAASQKFWISRCGDVFLIIAAYMLFSIFKTFNFEKIFEQAQSLPFLEVHSFGVTIVALLIVLGAMTKSAQFPFHFWLPNTMETPTPVSALMHAGIINAGGYLVIRMSPLLIQSDIAMAVLVVVGAITAVLGAIYMSVQPNVKKSLAYSTVSQMGFMMLQCGLGAFSIAVVHIIGHGLYKAYAFLSSGTATDYGHLNRYFPKSHFTPSLSLVFLTPVFSLAFVFGVARLVGLKLEDYGPAVLLYFILALAFSQILLSAQYHRVFKLKQNCMQFFNSLLKAVTLVFLYLAVSKLSLSLLDGSVAKPEESLTSHAVILVAVSGLLFFGLYLLQNSYARISKTKFGKNLYVRALSEGL